MRGRQVRTRLVVIWIRPESDLLTWLSHVSCRKYRLIWKTWRTTRSSRGGGGGGGGGGGRWGFKKYGRKWWFWSRKGRKLWRRCKKEGEKSEFWTKNSCGTRPTPEMYSEWWWWTSEGRAMWKECKAKGKTSDFWGKNKCGDGR